MKMTERKFEKKINFYIHWLRRAFNCVNMWNIFDINFLLYEVGHLQNIKTDSQSFKEESDWFCGYRWFHEYIVIIKI